MSIGGFGVAASRYGLPDFGILSYTEMRDAIQDIVRSVDLPVLVDGDGGYGDFLNIERMIREYEREKNISSIFLEDQVLPKRCGHLAGKQIIASMDMARKIRIASSARSRNDLWIMARTDARAICGLDEALRRGEAYLNAGADVLFIEAPESFEELEKIGTTFRGANLLVNALHGGKTPLLSQKEYENLGFNFIAHPTMSLLVTMKALEKSFANLHDTGIANPSEHMTSMKDFHDLIGVTEILEREKALKKE